MSSGIVVKELSGVARRWQTYLGRVVYVGLIFVVVYQFIASRDLRGLNNPSELADLGRRIFLGFVPFQMLFVTLVALSSGSDMISKEARAGTLGLLTLTPLTPNRIVFGKWRAAMAYASSVVFCGVPILAICVYLGGTGVEELAWSTTLTLAHAALAASLALLFSTVFKSGTVTILVGIGTIIASILFPILVIFATREEHFAEFFVWVHPSFAATAAAAGGFARRNSMEYAWLCATPVSLLVTWFFLRGAAFRLPRLAAAVPKPSLLIKTFESMDRFYEGIGPKAIRNVKVFGGSDQVWQSNALLWKELKTRASGKLRYATRIALFLLLIMILPASCGGGGESFWGGLTMSVGSILLIFMALAGGVSLFVKEKEARQWDILLSTPLQARHIVDAKLKAGLVGLLPLSVILTLFFLVVSWLARYTALETTMVIASALLLVVFAYTLAAAASLRAATMKTAFAVSFGIVAGILLILPLLLSFYDALPGVSWRRDQFPFYLVTITNPMALLDPIFNHHRSYYDSDYDYSSLKNRDLYFNFLVYSMSYGLGILSLRFYMVGQFNRITGRSGDHF